MSFESLLLHLDLQGLSGVEDELLEIPIINELLELISELSTIDCTVACPVMESTVVSGSEAEAGLDVSAMICSGSR